MTTLEDELNSNRAAFMSRMQRLIEQLDLFTKKHEATLDVPVGWPKGEAIRLSKGHKSVKLSVKEPGQIGGWEEPNSSGEWGILIQGHPNLGEARLIFSSFSWHRDPDDPTTKAWINLGSNPYQHVEELISGWLRLKGAAA